MLFSFRTPIRRISFLFTRFRQCNHPPFFTLAALAAITALTLFAPIINTSLGSVNAAAASKIHVGGDLDFRHTYLLISTLNRDAAHEPGRLVFVKPVLRLTFRSMTICFIHGVCEQPQKRVLYENKRMRMVYRQQLQPWRTMFSFLMTGSHFQVYYDAVAALNILSLGDECQRVTAAAYMAFHLAQKILRVVALVILVAHMPLRWTQKRFGSFALCTIDAVLLAAYAMMALMSCIAHGFHRTTGFLQHFLWQVAAAGYFGADLWGAESAPNRSGFEKVDFHNVAPDDFDESTQSTPVRVGDCARKVVVQQPHRVISSAGQIWHV